MVENEMRLVSARVEISYELVDEQNKEGFENAFANSQSGLDEWLSLARAKDEGENSDPLTLKLLTQVLRKLEYIEELLESKDGAQSYKLANSAIATGIGYEGFGFNDECLKSGEKYFAKVRIQGFVKKHIMVFFKALDEKTAKIERISKIDEKEWAQNVARCEMNAIRASKSKDNG